MTKILTQAVDNTRNTITRSYNNPHFVGVRAGLKYFFTHKFFDIPGFNLKNIFIFSFVLLAFTLPALLILLAIAGLNPMLLAFAIPLAIYLLPSALLATLKVAGCIIGVLAIGMVVEQALNLTFNSSFNLFSSLFAKSIKSGVNAANQAARQQKNGQDLHDEFTDVSNLGQKNTADFSAKLLNAEPDAKAKLRDSVKQGIFFLRDKAVSTGHGISNCAEAVCQKIPGLK